MHWRFAKRLMSALLLVALVLFVGLPTGSADHADVNASASTDTDLHDHNHHAVEPVPDHCHPGGDCVVTAIFILPPGVIPPLPRSSDVHLMRTRDMDSLPLTFDPPPPRPRS